jgi:hypothetical protein
MSELPDGIQLVCADDRGLRHAITLEDATAVDFDRIRAVRQPPADRGQRNFPGWWWSASTRSHVVYESWLERHHIIGADRDVRVTGISGQPFELTWPVGKKQVRHVPDLLCRMLDGRSRARRPSRGHLMPDLDAGVWELAELLQFLGGWLESDHDNLAASLARFVGSTAYGPASLREDFARFRFLPGVTDGEGVFTPDEPRTGASWLAGAAGIDRSGQLPAPAVWSVWTVRASSALSPPGQNSDSMGRPNKAASLKASGRLGS